MELVFQTIFNWSDLQNSWNHKVASNALIKYYESQTGHLNHPNEIIPWGALPLWSSAELRWVKNKKYTVAGQSINNPNMELGKLLWLTAFKLIHTIFYESVTVYVKQFAEPQRWGSTHRASWAHWTRWPHEKRTPSVDSQVQAGLLSDLQNHYVIK